MQEDNYLAVSLKVNYVKVNLKSDISRVLSQSTTKAQPINRL